MPDLPSTPVRIYFDIEGDAERRSAYLLGMITSTPESDRTESLWANRADQEADLFDRFLDIVEAYPDFRVFHYGSYESSHLKRMGQRSARPKLAEKLVANLVNVVPLIYSKVYFPTYTNSLKEVATHLGCSWTARNASGIQSLVWRRQWERTGDGALRDRLIQYNHEDCLALKRVTETLYEIRARSQQSSEAATPAAEAAVPFVRVQEESAFPQNREWKTVAFAVPEYDYINKCAYFDYQRERVYIRTNPNLKRVRSRVRHACKTRLRVNERRSIMARKCPCCGSTELRESGKKIFAKQVMDLKVTQAGFVRRVIEYSARRWRCLECRHLFRPPRFRRIDPYRHSLKSWAMYLHIAHQRECPFDS